jgi:hypothetical protein
MSFVKNKIVQTVASLLLLTLASTASQAATPAPIDPASDRVLDVIANMVADSHRPTIDHLRQVGYHADAVALPKGFASFPPLRKLETAYLAANHVSPENGKNFLALLARNLSIDYPSIKHDPALRQYFQEPAVDIVHYAALKKVHLRAPSHPHIQDALLALHNFIHEDGPVPTTRLLTKINMPDTEQYALLRAEGDPRRILGHAIQSLPESERVPAVYVLIDEVGQYSPSVYEEPAIKSFIATFPRPPPGFPGGDHDLQILIDRLRGDICQPHGR